MTPGMEVEVIGMGVEEETSSTPSDYLESVAVALISNNVSVYNFNLVTLSLFRIHGCPAYDGNSDNIRT